MPKSSIICVICGEDNETTATFCSECGATINTPSSHNTEHVSEPNQSIDNSIQSETSTSQTKHRSTNRRMMMMDMKPMFQVMPIMMLIMMVGVIIYLFLS